jgi:Pyruvate/2-oxoacid:ferredoxin oxidoreductase delta subunit
MMKKRIVFCNCQGKSIEPGRLAEISSYLDSQGVPFLKVTDLCGIIATQTNKVKDLFDECSEILMIACYPRGVRLLLNESGINTASKLITCLNMREDYTKRIIDQINVFIDHDLLKFRTTEILSDQEWLSWYPVIDYSRCSSCGQCADFCLFSVYEKRDGKVFVVNPHGCKNNCPACARICPQAAIVFPKYEHGGAIAGADSFDEIEEQKRQQQDINATLGSDIYRSLEKRKLRRQSIIRESEMQNAIRERDKALSEKEGNQ